MSVVGGGGAGLGRRHEQQLVVARHRQREPHVGVPEIAEAGEWIAGRGRGEQRAVERGEVLADHLVDEVLLVLEVDVDRGGRVLDPQRHLAERHRLDPPLREQLACGIDDQRALGAALPFVAFGGGHENAGCARPWRAGVIRDGRRATSCCSVT
jgi:hypothetical protein